MNFSSFIEKYLSYRELWLVAIAPALAANVVIFVLEIFIGASIAGQLSQILYYVLAVSGIYYLVESRDFGSSRIEVLSTGFVFAAVSLFGSIFSAGVTAYLNPSLMPTVLVGLSRIPMNFLLSIGILILVRGSTRNDFHLFSTLVGGFLVILSYSIVAGVNIYQVALRFFSDSGITTLFSVFLVLTGTSYMAKFTEYSERFAVGFTLISLAVLEFGLGYLSDYLVYLSNPRIGRILMESALSVTKIDSILLATTGLVYSSWLRLKYIYT